MKTAVEILEEQLYEWLDGRIYLPPSFFEQAKEMEKEQMIDSVIYGNTKPSMVSSKILGEEYYKETFKSE
jgi:hypothetical protein